METDAEDEGLMHLLAHPPAYQALWRWLETRRATWKARRDELAVSALSRPEPGREALKYYGRVDAADELLDLLGELRRR
jgi:hypothetical protein